MEKNNLNKKIEKKIHSFLILLNLLRQKNQKFITFLNKIKL